MLTGKEQRPALDVTLCTSSAEVIDRTETLTRTLLGRHPDLIVPQVIDRIVKRENAVALVSFGDQVLSKRIKREFIRSQGIALYLLEDAKQGIAAYCDEKGYPIPEENIRPVTDALWEVSFPQGGYALGFGGFRIYQQVEPDFKNGVGGEKVFGLGYDHIIRMEGRAGEMWQNWDYDWVGTPTDVHRNRQREKALADRYYVIGPKE